MLLLSIKRVLFKLNSNKYMQYYSLNGHSPIVDFKEATIKGQAPDKGLYFPREIAKLPKEFVKNIEEYSNEEIGYRMLQPYIGEDIEADQLRKIINETINFPIPLKEINPSTYILELFHGPTLAFKDVGARFMSRCLSWFASGHDRKIIVLVATSGDTGGAVASSFYEVPNVEVVILYPSGKVSPIQEKQLTTPGKNIHALEIAGNFDDCQALVKKAFADNDLTSKLFLTSANSINVARWLPQQVYYALAWKQWPYKNEPPIVSVPSGNFGNICAGLLAHLSGIPVKRFIAACNANDVIPQYFQTGNRVSKPAVPTASNAMDVADPSNFIRILELFERNLDNVKAKVCATTSSDAETAATIHEVFQQYNYTLDPHTAVAWNGLNKNRTHGEKGIVIGTAHPIKFPDFVEYNTGSKLAYPPVVQSLLSLDASSTQMKVDYPDLKEFLLAF
jgi:threonine synthase